MLSKRPMLPLLAFLMVSNAMAQVTPAANGAFVFPDASLASGPSVSSWFYPSGVATGTAETAPQDNAVQLLRNFKDSDIKFRLSDLMDTLRDHRHEGWVLAAYPDPNTRRPLIGAGFSLDVPTRFHPQTDALNVHSFLEPSSAELWQAAGLPPERLPQILEGYQRNLNTWSPKTYRHKIVRRTLTPDLTEEEGERLLRISAIQAVDNARAYCRNFDQLTGSQQMALSQLVFQMGVNLEQFVSFLGVLNDPHGARALSQLDGYLETEPEHWQTLQETLMDSQWARRYSARAISVIAMFDPAYRDQPAVAEQRIAAVLHPAVEVHSKRHGSSRLRLASYSKRSSRGRGRKAPRIVVRRKLT